MLDFFTYFDFLCMIILFSLYHKERIKFYLANYDKKYAFFTTIIAFFVLDLTDLYISLNKEMVENILHVNILEQFMYRLSIL